MVATHKDRDSRLIEHVGQILVARRLEVGLSAPAVRVEAEKVRRRGVVIVATLHVCPGILQNLADVSGGVSDWDCTARVLLDVVLEIALDGLGVC
jgi:hypothetical protein